MTAAYVPYGRGAKMRRSREPWRQVTTVDGERFYVDGIDGDFDDPVEAKHAAEAIHAIVHRRSDGAALTCYGATWGEMQVDE